MMKKHNVESFEVLSQINEDFYNLIKVLKKEHFDFCAFVVQGAYELYMRELENRFSE